jgi:cholesterol transport system auxiliary component
MNFASTKSKVILGALLSMILALGGCALQGPPARPAVYDFGPGPMANAPSPGAARLPALVVDVTDASAALDSTAVLYRLAYADEQQLRPYSQARWSMTPSQLLRQRLRERLGLQRTLLNPGDGAEIAAAALSTQRRPLSLRVELEEFSQIFTAPDASVGLLRLRATVAQANPAGEKWVAQRSIVVQRPAPSADAPGGVRALTAATDAALQELNLWLQELERQ